MLARMMRLATIRNRRRVRRRSLCPDDVERIAEAVVRRLAERLDPPAGRRFVDAAALARLLGVERDWIYAHAGELGGVRLGGPRGRLRFDLAALEGRLAPAAPPPQPRPARRARSRPRPAAHPAGGHALTPVQRRGMGPVRPAAYLVESPGQHRDGRAARQRPRPDTGRTIPDA